jgi:hypothetical protein
MSLARHPILFRYQSEDISYIPLRCLISHNDSIPSDLQLPIFLANRALIDASNSLAIKDSSIQHIDVTRAIVYYRLDEVHQFQRYHDSHRWNTAIFLGLLSIPKASPDPHTRDAVYVTPTARRFMICYVDAVLEHHNNPAKFHARETFIRLWKDTRYEFFTFGSGQKKLLKIHMKQLSTAWNQELDRVKELLGEEEYKRRVAKFVGTIIPGRRDQRARVKSQVRESKSLTHVMLRSHWVSFAEFVQSVESNEDLKMPHGTLLAALETPLGAGRAVKRSDVNAWAETLVKPRDAIKILKGCEPRVVLHHLMQIFPPEEEVDKVYCRGDIDFLTAGASHQKNDSFHSPGLSSLQPPQTGYYQAYPIRGTRHLGGC